MRDGRSTRLVIGGLLAMAAALGIGRFVYTPILPQMMEPAGWSAATGGLVASANYLGYLVGALVAARSNLPGDPRRWLLAALVVSAATTMAMALGSALPVASALRFAGGFASAIVIVCASTLVLQRLQESGHGVLAAVHFSGVGFGIAFSSMAVTALVAAGFGWQVLWLATGTIALLAVPLVARGIAADGPNRSPGPPSQHTSASPTPLRLLIVGYGLFGFGYVITATFLVTLVRETPAISALEPWIWLLVGAAAVPSVGLWSWLGARIGLAVSFAVASAILAFGVAASVEWRSPLGACVAATVLGGTFVGITALGLMAARAMSGGRSQRAIGQMTASFAIGQAIGPAVAGVLVDQLGSFRVPTLLAAAALVVAAALSLRAGAPLTGDKGRRPVL